MSIEYDKFILLGGSGTIGGGILKGFNQEIILQTPRSEINSWLGANNLASIEKYFSNFGTNTTVVYSLGITDPNAPIEQLELLNTILPTKIMNIVDNLGLKLITFGTILERDVNLALGNSYVRTKRDFLNRFQQTPERKNHLHLQLHTIYGGERSQSYMFIDQIFNALRTKGEFEMSSGYQVREYHHIEDEVNAIKKILESDLSGVLELNAGNAIQIKQLAVNIFEEFGQANLLKFNQALDRNDVFNHFYQKSPFLNDMSFRDPICGVIEYLKIRLENT